MYHEIIKRDGIDCAKVIQFKAGDYGYILDHNMSTSRGYKTVGDCKMILYVLLDKLSTTAWLPLSHLLSLIHANTSN